MKGVALEGVSVRVKGDHNPVLSNDDGTFSMLMTGKHNGDSYILQEVLKKGYELNEADAIGRQYAYSDKVPLTLVMVSSAQLQADKQRIENNAYQVAERNYKSKLEQLEKQKKENAISEEQYRKKLLDIQDKFEKYQLLIDGLSEHYAHVDYDDLNEKECEVNICIENGELERADSLIRMLFDPIDVLKRNKEALDRLNQQISEANTMIDKANEDMAMVLNQQEKDAEYLYQLYTIALSKFDKEKARFYIVTRAELDTTNVKWQTEAGVFLHDYYDEKQAYVYSKRAYECAMNQYGRYDYRTARCLSNLVSIIDNEDEKFEYIKDAFEILDSIGANDNTKVRNSLYVSLGIMAHSQKEDSLALMALVHAKENIEKLYPNGELLYTLYNNLGMVSRSLKDYEAELEYHKKALNIALSRYKENHYKVGWAYERIGGTLVFLKRYEEAQTYLFKAVGSVRKMYGDTHKRTQDLYLTLGVSSYPLHDWKTVYSSLQKVIPELQKELQSDSNDSIENKKLLEKLDLTLSVTLQAVDSLEISNEKIDYLQQLYNVKIALSKNDIGLSDVANRLGQYYYKEDSLELSRAYFAAAFDALKLSGNKSYRRNSICNNLYYTYMGLLSTSDSLKYKDEYLRNYEPYIDITLIIDDGETPASKIGMKGRYHLLKFENWNYKSLFSIFDYNQTLVGRPKLITVAKNESIQSYYFENRIGANIEVKYIDAADKATIIERYETLKELNHEIH